MPATRVDWRRVLVIELALLAGCVLAVIAWWVVTRFAHTVLLLLLGAVIAFALEPAVGRLAARLGGRRGLAAVIVHLAVLAATVGGLALLAWIVWGETRTGVTTSSRSVDTHSR